MNEFNQDFIDFWYSEVRDQALKCSPEYQNICNFDKLSEEEKLKEGLKLVDKGYKDLEGQYYIGKFIWAVQHALAKGSPDLNFINCFLQVKDTLNDEEYWKNVFNNDFSSEEAKNLKILAEMLKKLNEFL